MCLIYICTYVFYLVTLVAGASALCNVSNKLTMSSRCECVAAASRGPREPAAPLEQNHCGAGTGLRVTDTGDLWPWWNFPKISLSKQQHSAAVWPLALAPRGHGPVPMPETLQRKRGINCCCSQTGRNRSAGSGPCRTCGLPAPGLQRPSDQAAGTRTRATALKRASG